MRPPERELWKIVSVTGHRSLSSAGDLQLVQTAIQTVVRNSSVDAIYFGGARGVDTEALKSALIWRSGIRPHLTVVVPDTIGAQPWDTREWTRKADEVIELRNPIMASNKYASFRIRNQYLVEIASLVLAFWNGNPNSGTGQAVRLARTACRKVYTVKVSG